MNQKITKDHIIKHAIELLEEKGRKEFSLRALASRIGIKPASLYNHVKNLEEILFLITLQALRDLKDKRNEALGTLGGEEALLAYTFATRDFVEEHPELYELIMDLKKREDFEINLHGDLFNEPLMSILEDFHVSEDALIHYQRAFRALIHGFIDQERQGFFTGLNTTLKKSLVFSIKALVKGMEDHHGE